MGAAGYGIDPEVLRTMAAAVAEAASGTGLAIVVGGGNIFRGVSSSARDMDRAQADLMGMLATVMNALALVEALRACGAVAHVQSALAVGTAVPPFDRRRALECLERGEVVVFAAGTGNPFFTTDPRARLGDIPPPPHSSRRS